MCVGTFARTERQQRQQHSPSEGVRQHFSLVYTGKYYATFVCGIGDWAFAAVVKGGFEAKD